MLRIPSGHFHFREDFSEFKMLLFSDVHCICSVTAELSICSAAGVLSAETYHFSVPLRLLDEDSFKISRASSCGNTSRLQVEVSSMIHLQENSTNITYSIINHLPLQAQSSAALRYCVLCLKACETWTFQTFNWGTRAASPEFSLSA